MKTLRKSIPLAAFEESNKRIKYPVHPPFSATLKRTTAPIYFPFAQACPALLFIRVRQSFKDIPPAGAEVTRKLARKIHRRLKKASRTPFTQREDAKSRNVVGLVADTN
ncbi:hypothetical protein KM043_010091 [Ampulex compressa]|nr:hypothetical protein KM043_010091 [Ampulex compressa]